MNDDKKEHVHVYLAQRRDVNSTGGLAIYNGQWSSSKLLGSLLCSIKDIQHRIILANIAFNNFSSVWSKGRKISLQRLLRVYDAQVVSVLLYNCSSWAVPQHIIEKLDITHRKHLRSILKIKWTDKISNVKLYALTNTTPLSTRVAQSRWKLFGHILRSEENTPASTALLFAVNSQNNLSGRRGRHRINLWSVLKNDLKLRNIDINLNCIKDFYRLRDLASDRNAWYKLM